MFWTRVRLPPAPPEAFSSTTEIATQLEDSKGERFMMGLIQDSTGRGRNTDDPGVVLLAWFTRKQPKSIVANDDYYEMAQAA